MRAATKQCPPSTRAVTGKRKGRRKEGEEAKGKLEGEERRAHNPTCLSHLRCTARRARPLRPPLPPLRLLACSTARLRLHLGWRHTPPTQQTKKLHGDFVTRRRRAGGGTFSWKSRSTRTLAQLWRTAAPRHPVFSSETLPLCLLFTTSSSTKGARSRHAARRLARGGAAGGTSAGRHGRPRSSSSAGVVHGSSPPGCRRAPSSGCT